MGSFPIVINFWAAVSITAYYGANIMVMYYTRTFSHLKVGGGLGQLGTWIVSFCILLPSAAAA